MHRPDVRVRIRHSVVQVDAERTFKKGIVPVAADNREAGSRRINPYGCSVNQEEPGFPLLRRAQFTLS